MTITQEDFSRFRRIVQGTCGIRLDPSRLEGIGERLGGLVGMPKYPDFAALCDALEWERTFGGHAAWDKVLPLVTNNETYFFRDAGQFDLFRHEVLPALIFRGRDRLRVLSAPCSTGEEAYSVAMVVEECAFKLSAIQVEIFGTDIDRSALERAEAARYGQMAFRGVDPAVVARHFEPDGEAYRVKAAIRRRVKFRQVNLLDPGKLWPDFGRFDVVFCRNCLIYFDRPDQERVILELHKALEPGGYLFLGHSETLLAGDRLFGSHVKPAGMYYEKGGRTAKLAEGRAADV